jgi:hypothetical protein
VGWKVVAEGSEVGHGVLLLGGQRKQIPFGDDNQRCKNNSNDRIRSSACGERLRIRSKGKKNDGKDDSRFLRYASESQKR